jgi:microcystin-dependent protein
MGTDIQSGITFVDGNLYHDADFNAAVNNATLLPTAISDRSLKPTMSLGDELLINDAGTLRKVTGQQIALVAAVPAGCMMDYAGSTEPLGWVFCYGQLLNRVTYATLFAAIGTVYGAGDGSTTFAVPDCRGRVTAGDDNMGGTAANRITTAGSGIDGKVLGGAGGAESVALIITNLAAHTHSVPAHTHPGTDHLHTVPNHTHPITVYPSYQTGSEQVLQKRWVFWDTQTGGSTGGSGAFSTTAADRDLTTGNSAVLTTGSNGTGTAHNNVQPTIVMNKIIKT